MLESESPGQAGKPDVVATAKPSDAGLVLEGLSFANIVGLQDDSLITERGLRSTDGGRTWAQSKTFNPVDSPGMRGILGLVRLPNGQLGTYHADRWDMDSALGNAMNNWFFRRSSDEGRTWSDAVRITLDGLTQGLAGTMIALRDGKRMMVVVYSQFLGSRFDKRGASSGTLGGVRFETETEGHFPLAEVCRAYYSDDNGRSWQPSDGWIMGWRDKEKITDAFTEGDAVELADGRIMMIGRTLTGRLYEAFSDDRGHSWWPGARPMELMAPYSPGRICRLPKTGDLMVLWNQHSRAEIRKGFRRSRLSTAISRDEGKTWEHFKNLECIESLADVTRVPVDPDLRNVVGDDEVGELPSDYANFHYPAIAVVGNEVFVYYSYNTYHVDKDAKGEASVKSKGGSRTRILPTAWFYE